ncbi:MAG: hypothetical protein RL018_652, partial [Pseudomonadota bacterium]
MTHLELAMSDLNHFNIDVELDTRGLNCPLPI